MKKQLSDIRPDSGEQLALWEWADDVPFHSANQAAPYLGAWAEEYVAALWNGVRYSTQARRLCPDVQLADRCFAEVKAVSTRMCFTVYKGRDEVYREWIRKTKNRLFFVLVIHGCQAAQFKSRNHMRGLLPPNVRAVLCIPAQTLFKEVDRQLEEHGGWMHAANRAEAYQDYVIINAAWINRFLQTKAHRPKRTFPVKLHETEVPQVEFRCYKAPIPGDPQVGWHPAMRREAAQVLLDELESNNLEVMVDHQRQRRVVMSENADWYRRLCAEYPATTRRPVRDHTIITRRQTRYSLKQIIADRPIGPTYEERLRPYLKEAEGWIMREEPDMWADMEEAPF